MPSKTQTPEVHRNKSIRFRTLRPWRLARIWTNLRMRKSATSDVRRNASHLHGPSGPHVLRRALPGLSIAGDVARLTATELSWL